MSDSGNTPPPSDNRPAAGSLGKRPVVQSPEPSVSQQPQEADTPPEMTPNFQPPRAYSSQFPALYVPDPRAPVDDDDSLPTIIHKFLNPTKGYFSEDCKTVKLTLTYAIGKLGLEHFDYKDMDAGTRVLRSDSALREEGVQRSMPQAVMDWLLGDPIEEEMEFPAEILQGDMQTEG